MESSILERIFDRSIKPRDVKLSDLESITDNFSKDRIIGEGGFGTVYKGDLRNGLVAVKRIKNNLTIDEKLFQREVNSLLLVNHKNIVRFLGFCSHTVHKPYLPEGSSQYILFEARDRILCFEYINNGSLENYIADELRGLQWDTRYSIIKGICEGMQYLHMKKNIIHMDLKPANILLDHNMVAKITDFGLSRMVENSQTKSAERFLSPGYAAPEYIDTGSMTVKYDVYSLGIIIMELVTGKRSIPDINNVLRRWRHRWHTSGIETPFRYQQITKLIEIGLQCLEKDPYKRPFISDIISDISKLDSMDGQISNANESTVGQISPYPENDMLGIEPLELHFHIELNTQISCSVELTNGTDAFFAFSIQTTSPLPFCIQPSKYIVAPRSKYAVNITLQPLNHAPQERQYTGDFIVRSTKVSESFISDDINEDIFNREDGKLVDEVNLKIAYKAKVPQVDVSLGSLTVLDTCTQESNVSPTKISTSTLDDDVIQFDPPEICFPRVLDKRVLSLVKIINITDFYVCIMIMSPNESTGNYAQASSVSIISPRSTERLTVAREEKEDGVKDMQVNAGFHVRYAIVPEGTKGSDLDDDDYIEWKKLPIILTKANPCISNELIQFDPPELSLPFMPNKNLVFSVNLVNNTDHCVGFDVLQLKTNLCCFDINPAGRFVRPRSTQRILVRRIAEEKENEDMQCQDKFFLWSSIVSEGVQASDFKSCVNYRESKELPIVYKTTSLRTSGELIQFDPPRLPFLFLPNMRVSMLCFFKIVNLTDHNVGFKIWSDQDNSALYETEPDAGILPPESTQVIKVTKTPKEKELEDMQCKNQVFVWNGIVTEGVDVSDVRKYSKNKDKELPIVLTKIASSTLVELIKVEPPEVCFPFLPGKRLLSSIKIVNITEFHVGFNTHAEKTNATWYTTVPPCGVLAPWSTQELVVTRVAKEEALELEDMQCEDKYFVWSCFVTEDVNASDLTSYMPETERKELPIVFMETSSNDLIQFDPPQLFLPLLPNQRVLTSAKIINITDQYIGFRICPKKSNSARYYANPSEGILAPLSSEVLLVTSVAQDKGLEDTQCKDKFLVWNGIVTEDVKSTNVIDNLTETKCTELPTVFTKTYSSTSDELMQFDPMELHFPFLRNKRVLSSFKIVNLTDHNVGFNTYSRPTNAAWYHTEPQRGILPPRSTQKLIVTREEKEDALPKDKQLDDKYFVWKSIVSEGVKDSDLRDCVSDRESRELPIVLDTITSVTSDELIQLDPPELRMPHWPNKKIKFIVNVVNTTDFYVAFNVYTISRNATRCKESVEPGILPPGSTKRCIINWTIDEEEPEEDYFVWNRVVTKGVESEEVSSYMVEEESKKLLFVIDKESPCPSNGLIQFDPPELSLPFMPNKPLVFSINIFNNTDYYVCFSVCHLKKNVGWYIMMPKGGVMPPLSTQRVIVKRVLGKNERDGMQCEDKFFIWSSLVSEGVQDNNIIDDVDYKGSKDLPIVYEKTSLCDSDELIQFDPPQLQYDFLPNKKVSMFRFFKIINVTDHAVGFSTWSHEDNSAQYKLVPEAGILPPRSTQVIKVRRTLTEKEPEDMKCKDMIFVWNGIVTESVKVSDVRIYWKNGDKELPVVLMKPGESSSR